MEIKQAIWDKANRIIKERDNMRKYLFACKLAGICPACGDQVKSCSDNHRTPLVSKCIGCKQIVNYC